MSARLEAAKDGLCQAADAYVWDPTPDMMEALRNARAEWQTALGLYRLALRDAPSSRPDSRDAILSAIDALAEECIVALGQFSTEQLREMADERDCIRPDGWMQRMIREYLDVWR